MDDGCILQARQGSTCVLAFIGEIRYPIGPALSGHLDQVFREPDLDDVLIDLSATSNIDSTCLGLLAKVANLMRERFDRKPVLVSTRPDISELLDSLGFDQVFAIRHDHRPHLEQVRKIPSPASPTESELAWTVLDAHQVLAEMNEANRSRFRDVIEAIKADLAQQPPNARS